MAVPTPPFAAPTPSDIRDAILRVDRTGLIARGVANPNVTKTSDYWIRAESLSQQLAVIYANQVVKADQQMPDTSTGGDLQRILDIFGLSSRGAQGSSGNVVLKSSASVFIAVNTQLIDGNGLVYQVTIGGTYANGASVPIQAVSTGIDTNHVAGDVLQWVGGLAFADPRATVDIGGLIGGADADNDETSRNRLYSYFRNPPQGGNWSQVAQWAVQASASVQAAYVYPALNGPATLGICVVGPLTFDAIKGWTREVSSSTLATVATYVAARMPEHVDILVVTPTDTMSSSPDVDADIAVGLSLPLSAANGGPGGGWVDPNPWPDLPGSATRSSVSAVTSSTQFTLTSDDPGNAPTLAGVVPGQTTVAWFSPDQYAAGQNPLLVATVTSATGSTGAVAVTIDQPFTGIAVGDLVMPNAANIQTYASAALANIGQMGPGQWTAAVGVVPRANRRPLVAVSNPSDFTSVLLRAISDSGEEVQDTAYLYRSATTPGIPGDTTVSSPKIFVPHRLAFYNKIV